MYQYEDRSWQVLHRHINIVSIVQLFFVNCEWLGILHFEVKVADTFIGTKNCKLQKRLIAF